MTQIVDLFFVFILFFFISNNILSCMVVVNGFGVGCGI